MVARRRTSELDPATELALRSLLVEEAPTSPSATPLERPTEVEFQVLLLRHGLGGAARLLGICERTLRRRLQRRGIRPYQHLKDLRTRLTLQLLRTDARIAEAAELLGFSSSQSFARFVKRTFATTPTTLRERLRWSAEVIKARKDN